MKNFYMQVIAVIWLTLFLIFYFIGDIDTALYFAGCATGTTLLWTISIFL